MKVASPIHSIEIPSRTVRFSASQSRASAVGLDLADGKSHSTTLVVTETGDCCFRITTPDNWMVFVLEHPQHDALIRHLWYYSDLTLVPEGQLPVTIEIDHEQWQKIYGIALERGWK